MKKPQQAFWVIERANNPQGVGLPEGDPLYCKMAGIRDHTDWPASIHDALKWPTCSEAETFWRHHEASDPALKVREYHCEPALATSSDARPPSASASGTDALREARSAAFDEAADIAVSVTSNYWPKDMVKLGKKIETAIRARKALASGGAVGSEMTARVNYLTTAQNFALETALAVVNHAGFHVYLVGSCTTRQNFRDVDLRCILDDPEFDHLFKNQSVRLRLLNAALSEWIAARTDLPIDFQFQPYRDMPQFKGQPRNAMGILIECEAESDRELRQALASGEVLEAGKT